MKKISFTLIELLIYLFIMSIFGVLIIMIFYSIIFYSENYLQRSLLRTELFKILNRLYIDNIISTSTNVLSTSSIVFNLFPYGVDYFYYTSSDIYLNNIKLNSKEIYVKNFYITTSSNFISIFVELENKSRKQNIYATSVLYLWQFEE
jgi:type II secretory pathway pseudopilin PulG